MRSGRENLVSMRQAVSKYIYVQMHKGCLEGSRPADGAVIIDAKVLLGGRVDTSSCRLYSMEFIDQWPIRCPIFR